jgi:hypothetical protein
MRIDRKWRTRTLPLTAWRPGQELAEAVLILALVAWMIFSMLGYL